jgi:hypothetical protein
MELEVPGIELGGPPVREDQGGAGEGWEQRGGQGKRRKGEEGGKEDRQAGKKERGKDRGEKG